MSKSSRSTALQAQIDSRRAKVAAMVLRGVTNQFEIAARLGLDPDSGRRMVGRDIEFIRKDWRQSSIRDIDADKGRQLAEIALLKQQVWEAWERSKAERQDNRTMERTGGRGNISEAELRKMQRDGDPRFAKVLADLIDMENRILEIYPDRKEDRQEQHRTVINVVEEIVVHQTTQVIATGPLPNIVEELVDAGKPIERIGNAPPG